MAVPMVSGEDWVCPHPAEWGQLVAGGEGGEGGEKEEEEAKAREGAGRMDMGVVRHHLDYSMVCLVGRLRVCCRCLCLVSVCVCVWLSVGLGMADEAATTTPREIQPKAKQQTHTHKPSRHVQSTLISEYNNGVQLICLYVV